MVRKSLGHSSHEIVLAVFASLFFRTAALAQDGQDLARQLANPIASLTSVPIQFNYDSNIGPNRDGNGLRINIQPVIPFKLDSNWTLISRMILPVIYQNDIAPNSGAQFGLGDTVQSFFFSPSPVPLGGGANFIWGAGPVVLLPTGTDPLLTAREFGAGPHYIRYCWMRVVRNPASPCWSIEDCHERSSSIVSI